MARNGKIKRYWSGIRNVHNRLIRNDSVGKEARKEYFNRTKLKKYRESNYQKNLKKGKVYTLLETRKSYSRITKNRNDALKKEFKRLKKSGKVKGSFKDFVRANEEPDFDALQELFNSPT